jgi:hypothetical protein
LATLEDVLVPLYFLHRYQTEAVSKLIAGVEYSYQTRGDWQKPPVLLEGSVQRKAIDALLLTLRPGALRIPESILAILPPRPPAYPQYRELFGGHMGPAFDPLAAAEAAAEHTISLLLNHERAARLVYFSAKDSQMPGLGEVIHRLLDATWKNERHSGTDAELNRAVSYVVLEHLLALATTQTSLMQVRAIAHKSLRELKDYLENITPKTPDQEAANAFAVDLIVHFLDNPTAEYTPRPLSPPPGSPIGECSGYAPPSFGGRR